MSRVAELAYDIEQLFIEGHGPKMIAMMLDCPVEVVYDWLAQENLEDEEQLETFDPFETVNS